MTDWRSHALATVAPAKATTSIFDFIEPSHGAGRMRMRGMPARVAPVTRTNVDF
jgi:hypothetical protein